MLTPRNDQQMMQNMERVDEDQEEDVAAHDESQQMIVGPDGQMSAPAETQQ